ncbi:MAG TPA: archaemetzincin [Verrucomicrobiae bacterium]|nr:archaemetzincin [Verrucomicrobiae bacterium]
MNAVYLVAIGSVANPVLDWVEATIAEWCPWPVWRVPPLAFPPDSFDMKRGQYKSVDIMKAVARCAPPEATRILGVTEGDLAIPTLTFVFGQAQLDGAVAVVSLARLRQEFYGLPADENVLRERLVKEVLHELGHTFGLTHCAEPKCVMSLATHIGLVDSKELRYCGHCGAHLVHRFTTPDGEKS